MPCFIHNYRYLVVIYGLNAILTICVRGSIVKIYYILKLKITKNRIWKFRLDCINIVRLTINYTIIKLSLFVNLTYKTMAYLIIWRIDYK